MNTIGLIVLPWLCGLTTLYLIGTVVMLRHHIRDESVPVSKVSEEKTDIGGVAFHWPGILTWLVLRFPPLWPVAWIGGIPLFSFLRWWL